MWASLWGHLQVVERILAVGAQPDLQNNVRIASECTQVQRLQYIRYICLQYFYKMSVPWSGIQAHINFIIFGHEILWFCSQWLAVFRKERLRALSSAVICGAIEETKKGAVTGNRTKGPWFELSMLWSEITQHGFFWLRKLPKFTYPESLFWLPVERLKTQCMRCIVRARTNHFWVPN